ncbi:MAG: DNA cytosine methyltransferase [Pseudomonadota bacterium]
MRRKAIPIIDLFAGPGGLGEGFSAVRDGQGQHIFEIKASIEKDEVAHRTLTLRAIYRELARGGSVPETYYDYIRGSINKLEFLADPRVRRVLEKARHEAHCLELGAVAERQVDEIIRKAIAGFESEWVLIGGPPCQAYSIAGRARRRGVDPHFEKDPKHFLYREYLRIIQKFRPAVFVMENVKGMLSSTNGGQRIFDRIRQDLSQPAPDVYYDIRSCVATSPHGELSPEDFTIQSEDYGIPQMRHRVILFGVRSDRAGMAHDLLTPAPGIVTVREAIGDLPPIRSRISRGLDSAAEWQTAITEATAELTGWRSPLRQAVEARMQKAIHHARRHVSHGAGFMEWDVQGSDRLPRELADWYQDAAIGGICQHESRSHMRSDLHRYMFAACFAKECRYSPKLNDFPGRLLPNHKNVDSDAVPFLDRFKVQIYGQPSTTVVSHISKDGHYYIHPDPSQCRSLTVREAARLQTFPDNYFFEGNRTQQYHQVGNAVPPFLAKQIAQVVARFLQQPSKKEGRPQARGGAFSLV